MLNQYIRIKNGVPYIEFGKVKDLLKGLPTPMVDGQSGVQRWLKDRSKGLNRISNLLDYSQEISEKQLERFIFNAISIYCIYYIFFSIHSICNFFHSHYLTNIWTFCYIRIKHFFN